MMENQTDTPVFVLAMAKQTQMNGSSNLQNRNVHTPFVRLDKEEII